MDHETLTSLANKFESIISVRIATSFDIISYVFILILSLAVYWPAGVAKEGYFVWSDIGFPLNPKWFIVSANAWNEVGLGFPNVWLGSLPYYFLIFVIYEVGIPFWIINKMTFVLPVALRGCSMYYLMSILIKGNGWRKSFACFTASTFFMLIPLDVYVLPMLGLSLAAIPLIFALFIKGLSSEDENRYAFLSALATIMGFLYPLGIVFASFCILVFSFFHLIHIAPAKRRHYLYYLAKTGGLSLLVNAYSIFPFIASHQFFVSGLTAVRANYPSDYLFLSSSFCTLSYVTRLLSRGSIPIGYYSTPLMILISFGIVVFAYSSLFVSKNKFLPLFTICAVVSTAFSTGVSYPLIRDVYLWGYENQYLNAIFAGQLNFLWLLAVSYACMLGFMVDAALHRTIKVGGHTPSKASDGSRYKAIKSKVPTLATIVLCVMILINAYPVFSVSIFSNPPPIASGYAFHGTNVQVPSDYEELKNFLERDLVSGERVLVIPMVTNYYVYTWSGANGLGYVLPYYSPLPVLGIGFGAPPAVIAEVVNLIGQGNVTQAIPMLQVLSVRYVLVPRDIPELYAKSVDIEGILEGSTMFTIKKFDCFTLCTLSREISTDMIYAVPYSTSAINNATLILQSGKRSVHLSCSKVNPSYYAVEVNASEPFLVIFNQGFSEGWEAYVDGEPISSSNHLIVNGYANAWAVNKTGELDIELRFALQKLLFPSALISISAIVSSLLALTITRLWKKYMGK